MNFREIILHIIHFHIKPSYRILVNFFIKLNLIQEKLYWWYVFNTRFSHSPFLNWILVFLLLLFCNLLNILNAMLFLL